MTNEASPPAPSRRARLRFEARAARQAAFSSPPDSPPSAVKKPRGYTAVVYFHGMGSQRRYEELSRLLDSLDRFANFHHDQTEVGIVYDIEPSLEEPRPPLTEDTSYVGVRHRRGAKGAVEESKFRFYEAYWAPIMAGGVPALDVIKWLLSIFPAPLRALVTPWRLRARLRRSSLMGWWSNLGDARRREFERDDLKKLLQLYNDFEGPEARRAYPAGKYREFLEYLRSDHVKLDEPCRLRLLAMTSHWHAHYLRSELRNAFVLLTLLLVLLLGVGTLAAAIVLLLKWLGGSGVSAVVQRAGFVNLDEMLTPSWKNVSAILVLLAGLSGVTKFLRDYLGDVQTWTTYEETNEKFEKRKSVLKMSTDLLRFILEDDECDRMVVVAHSLGTTIAHDALLQLGRYNRARKDQAPLFRPIPLDKLDLLITFGSPVDKVHYFFESYAGRYHRYNRVSETLRGDIGEIPFAKNRQRNMHWINFWDQGDIISSSLETPSNRLFVDLAVDNTQVSSFVFPAPGASHSAYFDHRRVVGVMFDAIFNGKYSFHNPPRDDNHRPDYDAQMVGAGARLLVTKPLQVLMTLLPWLVLVTVASHLTTSASARAITLFLSTATAASLLVSWLYSRLRGHLARF